MNDLANPINITRLLCAKSEGTCEMSGAEFDLALEHGRLISQPPAIYEIKTWGRSRVTAIREHPCGTASLTVVRTHPVTRQEGALCQPRLHPHHRHSAR
jgi:hypothetical protein